MKKLSFIAVIVTVMIIGIYNLQQGFATTAYSLNNNSMEIHEFSDGQEKKLLIKIDKNGHFYSEVLVGTDKGNFEAWDGENFYRYNKSYNELIVAKDPKDGSKVVAHPILSDVISDRIAEDISNNSLKKSLFSSEYKKTKITEEQKIVEKIKFDKKNHYPQTYKMEIDNEVHLQFKITNISDLKENLNIQDYINLDRLKNNDVKITNVEMEY